MGEFSFDDLFDGLGTDIFKNSAPNFHDSERKYIGDRVKINDYSSISTLSGDGFSDNEFNEVYDYNFIDENYFIVIDTTQRAILKTKLSEYKQDLIIVNPKTNKFYRIFSGHVKIHNIK